MFVEGRKEGTHHPQLRQDFSRSSKKFLPCPQQSSQLHPRTGKTVRKEGFKDQNLPTFLHPSLCVVSLEGNGELT